MMQQQQQPMGMMGNSMPGMMAPNPGMMGPNPGMMGPNPGMMGMQHSPLMMSNTPTPPPIHPSPAPAVGTPPVEWAIPQQKRVGYMAQFQVSGPDPGSEFFFSIPNPRSRVQKGNGSRIRIRNKELSIFNPTNCYLAVGNMIKDVFHPGSEKQRIRIRNTGLLPELRVRIHFYAEANADWNSEAHAFFCKRSTLR